MAVKHIRISKEEFYNWGGFANRQLFRRKSPNGTMCYYRIDKS